MPNFKNEKSGNLKAGPGMSAELKIEMCQEGGGETQPSEPGGRPASSRPETNVSPTAEAGSIFRVQRKKTNGDSIGEDFGQNERAF